MEDLESKIPTVEVGDKLYSKMLLSAVITTLDNELNETRI